MTAPLHVWHIECVSYTPAWRQDGDLIGFATFELAGGMRLADGRVVRTARSGLGLVFPKRGVIKAREVARRPDGELLVVRQIEFPRTSDWVAFSGAAISAILRAYPDAFTASSASPEAPTAPARASPISYRPEPPNPVSASLPDFLTMPVTTRIN